MFHALAKIPVLPFSSAQEVRNAVVSYVLHGRAGDYRLKPTAARTLQSCTRKYYEEDVESWAERMKQCGAGKKHWGTTWEATIVAYMCGIEIIVLTNIHSGVDKVSSKETLRMNNGEALLDSFPAVGGTFYLLHHQCGFPSVPSDPTQFNHYAFLQAVTSIPSEAKTIIYNFGENKPKFYNFYDALGKKEESTNSLMTHQSALFSPPMTAQDGGYFSPRFTGTVSERLKWTMSSHKGVKKECKAVRKTPTPRKHMRTSSRTKDLPANKIKQLIDCPSERAEALELAEVIATINVTLAAASARLDSLLQSKNQKTINLHNTSQDKSPEQVEVCANEAKMATPGYIGCAEVTAMKKKRVDRMERVAINLKRKKYHNDPIDESLKEAVASLFPTAAKRVGSPMKAKAAKVISWTDQNSKDTSTKLKQKANQTCKRRTNTKRAPQRITAIKSQVNRRTLQCIAEAVTKRMWPLAPGAWPGLSQSWPSFDVSLLVHDAILPNRGGSKKMEECRRKKPKNIILTQNESSAKRIRESFQFSEDSEKYEYVVCHDVEQLFDAMSDKEKKSQHTMEGAYKSGILHVASQNPSGAQLFTPPVSFQN
jgi:hypothetical protein